MSNLNTRFFDEFKKLDNLCKDMYSDNIDKKLGVTMYIEDMESKEFKARYTIDSWDYYYERLREVRAKRNELAHGNVSFSENYCYEEDVNFVVSFKNKILNQTDPLSLYEKSKVVLHSTKSESNNNYKKDPVYDYSKNKDNYYKNNDNDGCLKWVLLTFGIIVLILVLSYFFNH